MPNELVGIRRPDNADPKRPRHEVLVASERLDIGFAAGWAGLGVREVQSEVAADDWKVVHGDPVNHQNILLVTARAAQVYGYHLQRHSW